MYTSYQGRLSADYSYRLSIIILALIFLYIWADDICLGRLCRLGSDSPAWFFLDHALDGILGGMINGLMTLSGAWEQAAAPPGPCASR